MKKTEYLLKYTSENFAGYLYVYEENENPKKFDDFKVKMKTTESRSWKEISSNDVLRYRDGGTTTISCNKNSENLESIFVPAPGRGKLPFVTIDGEDVEMQLLDFNNLEFDHEGNPVLDDLPDLVRSTKRYRYCDVYNAIKAILKPYNVTTKPDIVEHTLLRLASISFSFDGRYQFGPFEEQEEMRRYFIVYLEIDQPSIDKFLEYFNHTYGVKTAIYTPYENIEGNRSRAKAVLINLHVMMDKVLPDFEIKIKEILSDPSVQKIYSLPFNELDEETKNMARDWNISSQHVKIKNEHKPTLFNTHNKDPHHIAKELIDVACDEVSASGQVIQKM
jgi:hypothetical protein